MKSSLPSKDTVIDTGWMTASPTLSTAGAPPAGPLHRQPGAHHARAGTALLVPTSWDGEACMRVCFVHPQTSLHEVLVLLDDMARDDMARDDLARDMPV